MAEARILFPQFRDEQGDSRYPFADTATLVSRENKLTIASDTFLDASIYVIDGGQRAYIASIVVTNSTITITVRDVSQRTTATTTWTAATPPTSGALELFDSFGRPAGMLLSTPLKLARFAGWPIGTHTFSPSATEFVAGVVIPAQEPGVRGLLPKDSTDPLTGDVWLIGDRGVVLRCENERYIRIDIIGDPLFKRAICGDPNFTPPPYVKTINGCPPDEYGNWTLTATNHSAADAVLRIYPLEGNLKIDMIGRRAL